MRGNRNPSTCVLTLILLMRLLMILWQGELGRILRSGVHQRRSIFDEVKVHDFYDLFLLSMPVNIRLIFYRA